MPDELRIRRVLTIQVDGEHDLVNDLMTQITRHVAPLLDANGRGKLHYRFDNRMDLIDAEGKVITGEVAELARRQKAST